MSGTATTGSEYIPVVLAFPMLSVGPTPEGEDHQEILAAGAQEGILEHEDYVAIDSVVFGTGWHVNPIFTYYVKEVAVGLPVEARCNDQGEYANLV
jgi:hypothetical protein